MKLIIQTTRIIIEFIYPSNLLRTNIKLTIFLLKICDNVGGKKRKKNVYFIYIIENKAEWILMHFSVKILQVILSENLGEKPKYWDRFWGLPFLHPVSPFSPSPHLLKIAFETKFYYFVFLKTIRNSQCFDSREIFYKVLTNV